MKYIIGEIIIIIASLLTMALILLPMRMLDSLMEYLAMRRIDRKTKFSQLKRLSFYIPLISVMLTSCSSFKEPTTEQILIKSRVYKIMLQQQ